MSLDKFNHLMDYLKLSLTDYKYEYRSRSVNNIFFNYVGSDKEHMIMIVYTHGRIEVHIYSGKIGTYNFARSLYGFLDDLDPLLTAKVRLILS